MYLGSQSFQSDNIDDLWQKAARFVLEQGSPLGSRDGACLEILGTTLILTDTQRNFLMNPTRKLSPIYANAELLWYLSGENRIDMIRAYAPQYERFSENGIAHGAYGRRIRGSDHIGRDSNEVDFSFYELCRKKDLWINYVQTINQLDALIRLLKNKPETRQAVLQLWKDADLVHALLGDKKDLPCTLNLQFFLRQGKLLCINTMRSNDLWLGTPYDIYCFSTIHRLIAEEVGCEVGDYVHQVGSLHLYDRNVAKAKEAIEEEVDTVLLGHGYTGIRSYSNIQECVNIERDIRQGIPVHVDFPSLKRSVMYDVLCAVASKWIPSFRNQIQSPGILLAAIVQGEPKL